MSRTVGARLARLERRTVAPTHLEVWRPAQLGGTDRYACPDHPGEVLTAALLDARPTPPRTLRVTITRTVVPSRGGFVAVSAP